MKKLKNGLLQCKLSFDFDGVLNLPKFRVYAQTLVDAGHEVWILTSRFENSKNYQIYHNTPLEVTIDNTDLYNIADSIGISRKHIHFTNLFSKSTFVNNRGFLWHLDDNWSEVSDINKNCKETKSIISIGNDQWKHKCNRLIKTNQKGQILNDLRDQGFNV